MTAIDLETARTEQLAADYEARGYEVHVHPDRRYLPDSLIGFSPTLVALSSDDKVVIDVTTARDFDAEHAQRMAERVERERPWRYEVAFVSLPTAPDVPVIEDLASDDQIARLIENAELLGRQNQVEASALLAWSAVDAILRKLTRRADPEIERESSARVLKGLYALGRIDPEVYETLLNLMAFRNAVGHGFSPRGEAPGLAEVLQAIRWLQSAA